LAFILEVDMPAFRLAGFVLERESKHSISLLDSVFTIGIRGGQGFVDYIEGRRGRKCSYDLSVPCAAREKSGTYDS
jgi:hypothetical protein